MQEETDESGRNRYIQPEIARIDTFQCYGAARAAKESAEIAVRRRMTQYVLTPAKNQEYRDCEYK